MGRSKQAARRTAARKAKSENPSPPVRVKTPGPKAACDALCDICGISLPSGNLEGHLRGKKHVRQLALCQKRKAEADRSVYVKGFPSSTTSSMLVDHFKKFGEVKRVHLEKRKGVFAIVEFTCATPVDAALEHGSQNLLGGKKLIVRRKTNREPTTRHWQSAHPTASSTAAAEAAPAEESASEDDVVSSLRTSATIIEQMKRLEEMLALTEADHRVREQLAHSLQAIFETRIKGCKMHIFGSSVSGLGVRDCDMDIFLELPLPELQPADVAEKPLTAACIEGCVDIHAALAQADPVTRVAFLKQVLLQSAADRVTELRLIPATRCPVLRFRDTETGILCDMSIKNRLALYNTELVKVLCKMEPRLHPLLYSLRYIFKRWQLSSASVKVGISNYALCWLMVTFLQMRGVLPSIGQLADWAGEGDRMTAGGWDCSFTRSPENKWEPNCAQQGNSTSMEEEETASVNKGQSAPVDEEETASVNKEHPASTDRKETVSVNKGHPASVDEEETAAVNKEHPASMDRKETVSVNKGQPAFVDKEETALLNKEQPASSSLRDTAPNQEEAACTDELLVGFFEFYNELELAQVVVCPREGRIIQVDKFEVMSASRPGQENFKLGNVNIQDPFVLDHNLTQGMPDQVAGRLTDQLREAHTKCSCAQFSSQGLDRDWGLLFLVSEERLTSQHTLTSRPAGQGPTLEGGADSYRMYVDFRPDLLPQSVHQQVGSMQELQAMWRARLCRLLLVCLRDILLFTCDVHMDCSEERSASPCLKRPSSTLGSQAPSPKRRHVNQSSEDQPQPQPLSESDEEKDGPQPHEEHMPDQPLAEGQEEKDGPQPHEEHMPDQPVVESQEEKDGPQPHEEHMPDQTLAESQEEKDGPQPREEHMPDQPLAESQEEKDRPQPCKEHMPDQPLAESQEEKDGPQPREEHMPDQPLAESQEEKDGPQPHEEHMPDQTLGESQEQTVLQLTCHTPYQVWAGRRQAKQKVQKSLLGESRVKAEKLVTEFLMKTDSSGRKLARGAQGPVLGFELQACVTLKQGGKPQLTIEMRPNLAPKLFSTFFPFFRTFFMKVVATSLFD